MDFQSRNSDWKTIPNKIAKDFITSLKQLCGQSYGIWLFMRIEVNILPTNKPMISETISYFGCCWVHWSGMWWVSWTDMKNVMSVASADRVIFQSLGKSLALSIRCLVVNALSVTFSHWFYWKKLYQVRMHLKLEVWFWCN